MNPDKNHMNAGSAGRLALPNALGVSGRANPPGEPTRLKKGFTLIEILVVLVIVMGLAGIVTVGVMRHQVESRVKMAQLQISQFEQALQAYHLDHGRYPTQAQGLEALVRRPTASPVPERYPEEGYLARTRLPLDPWGNEYIYLAPGRRGEPFEIISYGSDGEPGGSGHAAEISSSDL